jgi:hypothetical protein
MDLTQDIAPLPERTPANILEEWWIKCNVGFAPAHRFLTIN